MPDLQDESELAGNGASRVSEDQQSHSNEDTSPSRDHKASESDQPKKKRKVNHGEPRLLLRRLFLTDKIPQHVSIAVARYACSLTILSALPNLDRYPRDIMG